MNKIKISFAFVISITSALLFGFVSFLSLNFLSLGDIRSSITTAVAISILFWTMAFGIKKMKSVKRNFQRSAVLEIIALAIYIIAAVISLFIPYSHYFTVSDRKHEIKVKIVADVDKTIKMFSEYEDYANRHIQMKSDQLTTAIRGKDFDHGNFLKAGFIDNEVPILSQKNGLLRIYSDNLLPAQYDTLKVHAIDWLKDAKTSALNWKPIGIMDVIKSFDNKANEWLSKLKDYAKSIQDDGGISFKYKISFTSIEPEFTDRNTPTIMAFVSATILHLFLFFPYFFTYRNLRHSGLINELLTNQDKDDGIGIPL